MLVISNHYSTLEAEKTYLTEPASASATSLTVKSNDDFSQNDYVILGELGTENCEIKKVNAAVTAGTALTITACTFAHAEGEPITFCRYNQVRFYMSTTQSGTYTVQTTVEMDVDNPDKITVWDDTDGASTNWYKTAFYNDVTTLESSLSDAIPGAGLYYDTVRQVTDEILKEAKDENESFVSRDEVRTWMNECQMDVSSRKKKWSFLARRATATRTGSQEAYSLSTHFGISNISSGNTVLGIDFIDHLTYNYVVASPSTNLIYRLRYVPLEKFDQLSEDTNADESNISAYWTWDKHTNNIRISPTADTNLNTAYYLYYYKRFNIVDSDGDSLEIPDTRVYKFYCLYRFWLKKEDVNMARMYQTEYERAMSNLQRKERVEAGQPRGIRYVPKDVREFFKY